jgi:molybdenum cofactor cytidylyltransferase
LSSAIRSALEATVLAVPAGAAKLIRVGRSWPVELLRLDQPTQDMRQTVAEALRYCVRKWSGRQTQLEAFVLLLGDQPTVRPETIDSLIRRFKRPDNTSLIVVPRYGRRRGHPVLFAWKLAKAVDTIPIGRGLDYLLELHADLVAECELDDPEILADVDTPQDYERVRQRWGRRDEH